ncbi:MAG: glycosyl hydrolase [Ignavibacteriales bacterium]|nr:MAG: glycosyl hydrolase [Ignavibacteriales bacterium]
MGNQFRNLIHTILKQLLLIFICSFVSFAQSSDNNIPKYLSSFDLSEVKLLDGPFNKAMQLNKDYLLQIDPDRLLSWFYKEAGLSPKAEAYRGWERETIAGHSLGHYLSACAMTYASTQDERLKEKVNYILNELEVCQKKNGNGFVAAFPNGQKVFDEIEKGEIRSKGFDLNGIWVPWYTLHKQIAGLLDAYHYCNNPKGLEISVKLADWAVNITRDLNEEQFQKMLDCEHGGMNEVLAELYYLTENESYLVLSKKFHHKAVLDPLTNKEDKLKGLHSNTQIPKIIGLARRYELTQNVKDKTAAEFFWDAMVHHHSYVIGGNSENEYLSDPDKLSDKIGYSTCETCNTYNMLKLTKHLFKWNPTTDYADYYERALYNHILASQQPDSGMFCYFLPLKPGGYKTYSDKFNSFWCCVGSGMENHSKYGESIYFHSDDELWINLFIASELNWKEKNFKLKQETRFPDSDEMKFTIECQSPQDLSINLRYPAWAKNGIDIRINGEKQNINLQAGNFIRLMRTWNNGDVIEVKIPMSLRLESMPDNQNRVAVCYGPLVLAGDLGPEDDPKASESIYVPVFINENKTVDEWIKPVDGKVNHFTSVNVGKPRDITLKPFYLMHNRRYSVYWDIFTKEQWGKKENEYLAEVEYQNKLEKITVDFIQPGEMQPERDHNMKGENTEAGMGMERKWREAYHGGWFSFDMSVKTDEELSLVCTYWGGDSGRRTFDILVDNSLIATQSLQKNNPDKYFDVTYKLPRELTRDKEKITVKFQAHPDNLAGGVFGIRLVKEQK